MDDILFSKGFTFLEISRRIGFHTDNSQGIDCHYIGRMLEGEGRIEAEGEEMLELCPGDIFYFPKGLKYHSYWNGRGGLVRFESFRFELYPALSNERFALQKLDTGAAYSHFLDEIAKDMRVTPRAVGLLYSFLASVLPHMKMAEPDVKRRLFIAACRYIEEHSDFRVPALAKHLGMSESGCYAFFKGFGTTPIEVKNGILAERARTLLVSSDLSVEDICGRVGFSSAAYFRRLMKEKYGETPNEIRKNGKLLEQL